MRLFETNLYILNFFCSFMGYDDLSVIDPTTGEAKTAETDLNDVRWSPVSCWNVSRGNG